jgi:hypothetical protein
MNRDRVVRSCPSELTLERLRQGELPAPEAARLEPHIRDCLSCRRLLHELQAAPPPLSAVETSQRPPLAVAMGAGMGMLAAAILLFWWHPEADTMTKGPAWQLTVIAADRDGHIGSVDPGAPLSPGDRLRFEVFTRWPRGQVALLSVDGSGVSPLLPAAGTTLPVSGGHRTLLDGAVELDQSMGPERILLIACRRPLAVADLVSAARQALARAHGDARRMTALELGCHEESFWINKVPR